MHFSWSSCTTIQSTVSKGKQDQRHPQKIFAAQDIIKTLYSNKEATDYLQKPEKDEKDEISILRTAWWEFQIFRLQQPPRQTEIVEFLEVHGSKSSGDLREELSSLNQIVTGTGLLQFLGVIFLKAGPLKRRPFSDQKGVLWTNPPILGQQRTWVVELVEHQVQHLGFRPTCRI